MLVDGPIARHSCAMPDFSQPQFSQLQGVPGYRRRIMVEARAGGVAAMLEDDIHCLAVVLREHVVDGRRGTVRNAVSESDIVTAGAARIAPPRRSRRSRPAERNPWFRRRPS